MHIGTLGLTTIISEQVPFMQIRSATFGQNMVNLEQPWMAPALNTAKSEMWEHSDVRLCSMTCQLTSHLWADFVTTMQMTFVHKIRGASGQFIESKIGQQRFGGSSQEWNAWATPKWRKSHDGFKQTHKPIATLAWNHTLWRQTLDEMLERRKDEMWKFRQIVRSQIQKNLKEMPVCRTCGESKAARPPKRTKPREKCQTSKLVNFGL